ncbi:MAG: tRNA pseudouridine(55) synthase TruB [Candidatus Geothermincolales bacterium]
MGSDVPSGVLLVDKPEGPSSHDVVIAIRKSLGIKKAGHAGTLDPMASGLLVVLLGTATKLAPYIPADPKVYEGSMILGMKTDTMDLEGRPTGGCPFEGDEEEVRKAIEGLVGERVQVPPAFSAAKVRGIPLYSYARKGIYMQGKPKKVKIYQASMSDFRWEESGPVADFLISCSPGTYVRELVDAIGNELGCGAVLSRLKRLKSGPFGLEEALSLDLVVKHPDEALKKVIPASSALSQLKKLRVAASATRKARNGSSLHQEDIVEVPDLEKGETVAVVEGDYLVGIYTVISPRPIILRPLRVFPAT